MLIWIDPSITQINWGNNADACSGIEAVFRAFYLGDHFVLSDRSTLTTLKNRVEFSNVTRLTINKIINDLPILGDLKNQVSIKVNVVNNPDIDYIKLTENTWNISLQHLGRTGISKSILLAENLDDASLYIHAGRQYKIANKINAEQSIERAHGGGSTTPECLQNLTSNEKKFCFCITDSDRECPDDTMGAMAARCKKIASETQAVAKHMDLQVREIENLIPLSFIKEAIPPTHIELWENHEKLIACRNDLHSYVDLKEGLQLSRLLSLPNGSPRKQYWMSILDSLTNKALFSSPCDSKNSCIQPICNCIVANGFGPALSKTVLDLLDKQNSHKSLEISKNDSNHEAWESIGRDVFEWGISPKRMRL